MIEYNNKNFLPSIPVDTRRGFNVYKTSIRCRRRHVSTGILPGLPIFFASYHFIFTENKHGFDKLISILKQKRRMLKVQVNDRTLDL